MCESSQIAIIPSLMKILEFVYYPAALTVTGTWSGTSSDKLYAELSWETLSARRWSRRLTLFYKIINNLTPLYTKEPLPPLHQSQYFLRRQAAVWQIVAITDKFKSSFYPNCIFEWNKLDPEIRPAPSVVAFKKKLLSKFIHLQSLFLVFMTHSAHLISLAIKTRS